MSSSRQLPFKPLLHAVVAMGAERLPIRPVPEQGAVTTMRNDVVDRGGKLAAIRHGAAGMDREEVEAGLTPIMVIAALPGRQASPIMTGTAQAPLLALAAARDVIGNAVATRADAGRTAHRRGFPYLALRA